jgi:hypothetical protein
MVFEEDPLMGLRSFPLRSTTTSPQRMTTRSASIGDGKKKDGFKIHRVSYTAKNHVQVLFQMYGSALPQVLPFCMVNILWTVVIFYLREKALVDITFKSVTGHSFMVPIF